MFDIKNAGKYVLPVAGAILTVAASIVSNKNQDAKMNEAVAEKVAEALSKQAKGES